MTDRAPWDYHPDLSEERLLYVADQIAHVRREALELHDEEQGDTPWSFGCRVYDRTRMTLIKEAEGLLWLSIVDPSLRFIFQIGSVPIRIYRGEADEPTERTLSRSFPELKQISMEFSAEDRDLLWRFAVEADSYGDITAITFIGTTDSGEIRCSWDAPLIDPVATVSDMGKPSGDGVELTPPTVLPPANEVEPERGSA